jgi:tol-pal system protein YbgF
MTLIRLSSLVLAASLLTAAPALPQADPLTDPLPRALGQQADRRLDRVEQTLREMRAILYQGRDTGRAVVVQPAETQGQLELMTRKVDDLEATLRTINSQLDALAADISTLRRDTADAAAVQQQRQAANTALIARIDALEKRLDEQAARVVADPVQGFQSAMQAYLDGQNGAAATGFQSWLDANPDAEQAPEARYYLGEALFKQAAYDDAAIAYVAAIRGWPTTAWAPDATVKLARSLIEIKKTSEACGILTDFNSHYPRATATVKSAAAAARTRARC